MMPPRRVGWSMTQAWRVAVFGVILVAVGSVTAAEYPPLEGRAQAGTAPPAPSNWQDQYPPLRSERGRANPWQSGNRATTAPAPATQYNPWRANPPANTAPPAAPQRDSRAQPRPYGSAVEDSRADEWRRYGQGSQPWPPAPPRPPPAEPRPYPAPAYAPMPYSAPADVYPPAYANPVYPGAQNLPGFSSSPLSTDPFNPWGIPVWGWQGGW